MCEVKAGVSAAGAAGCVVAAKVLYPALAFLPAVFAAEMAVAAWWGTWLVLMMRREYRRPAPVRRRQELPARAEVRALPAARRALPASPARRLPGVTVVLDAADYERINR